MSSFDLTFIIDYLLPFLATPIGVIIFIIFYSTWVILLFPGSWLTMVAGLLYGSYLGSVYVFIAAIIGSLISFFLGRTFLRNWVQRKISAFPKLLAIEKGVSQEGWKLVILTRLSPAFPFSLLNYFYGVSDVKLVDFNIGLLGILPGTFLYCSFGKLAGEISNFQQAISQGTKNNSLLITSASFIVTFLVVVLVARVARNVLQNFDSSEIS